MYDSARCVPPVVEIIIIRVFRSAEKQTNDLGVQFGAEEVEKVNPLEPADGFEPTTC